ncbi:MAG: hypothetical protein ABSD62_06885 [Candidatus Limnocylindrales bacterium]|jgi:hypothetical protein
MTTPNAAAGTGAAELPVWTPAIELAADEDVPAGEVEPARVSKPHPRLRPRSTNSTSILLVIGALVAFGGVGFAVGHATSGQTSSTTQGGTTSDQFGPNASGIPGDVVRGGFGGDATVTGTVVSVATDSITVKLANGSTVTIATGSSTTYHNQTAGSSTDLAAGQTVQVQTSGGADAGPNASASPGTQTTRTATDVTITSK